jgi:hypothetical protein
MKHVIKKYGHQDAPSFGISLFRKKMVRKFKFESNCAYDLKGIDQFDINKLFGWSQLLHHKNSCRFGWTWNLEKKAMEIHAYCYVKGIRKNEFICLLDLEKWYIGEIKMENGKYYFNVKEDNVILGYTSIQYDFSINIGYNLDTYFGGNQNAPHDMTIYIDRV